MSVATIICGAWSLTRIFNVVRSGGVGKNGSTVAVSLTTNKTKQKFQQQKNVFNFFYQSSNFKKKCANFLDKTVFNVTL